SLAGMTIRRENPFLHADLAAQMDDLGLQQFTMGSFNFDLPYMSSDNIRRMSSYALGLEGDASALGTDWRWTLYGHVGVGRGDVIRRKSNNAIGLEGDASALGTEWRWTLYGQVGVDRIDININVMNRARFARAIDSVRTASGQIVCAVNADANPANDDPACVP